MGYQSHLCSKAADILVMLYLFTRANIFSEEFTEYLKSFEWGENDLFLKFFMGTSATNSVLNIGTNIPSPILVIIGMIVFISSIVACSVAVYKTLKNYTGK